MGIGKILRRMGVGSGKKGISSEEGTDSAKKHPFDVKIIRSHKRHRTISARLKGETMFVYAPAKVSDRELSRVIGNFAKRLERKRLKRELNEDHDLEAVAEMLNKAYFNSRLRLRSIKYVTNQDKVFGSCNYRAGDIRISHRLSQMPDWVRDYVIIHEMAHLIEPNHSRAFWDIVYRYKLAERARGYLMAKGFDMEEGPSDIEKSRPAS